MAAKRKAIILAGGSGSRMYPLTVAVSKQLLAVYDKPLIYYPLSCVLLTGIQEALIITTPHDQAGFKRLLGDGSQFGMELSYTIQEAPNGLAEAFILGADFLAGDSAMLVLGDNIFYGHGLPEMLHAAHERTQGATVFAYRVSDPERYGVVQFNEAGRAIGLEEKPKQPKSNYAVPGIYFYDNEVVDIAANLKPSDRGELEITDVNRTYLDREQLFVETMGRGMAWLDTGTHESMAEAANFVETVEKRQGLKVCCPEEIAFRNGFISKEQLAKQAQGIKSEYGRYLKQLVEE